MIYIVTKPSKNKEFQAGDHIRFMGDGSIICREAQGWIDKEDVPEATKGMEYEVDKGWIERRKSHLTRELGKIKQA